MVWFLQGGKVAEHLEHPRQFSVITPTRTCYLRVKDREKRGYWVKAIQVRHPSTTLTLMSMPQCRAYIWCTVLQVNLGLFQMCSGWSLAPNQGRRSWTNTAWLIVARSGQASAPVLHPWGSARRQRRPQMALMTHEGALPCLLCCTVM